MHNHKQNGPSRVKLGLEWEKPILHDHNIVKEDGLEIYNEMGGKDRNNLSPTTKKCTGVRS